VSTPTKAKFYTLCILLFICSYMFRHNCHPQGNYNGVVKTYG